MKKLFLGLGSIAIITTPVAVVISCGSANNSTTNYRTDFTSGNAWYTGSAEMKAMASTEYKAAETMFDELAKQAMIDTSKVTATTGKVENPSTDKFIPVVFMDIDETILSNIAYQNYNVLNNKTFSPTSWEDWVKAEKATAIAGSIKFIKYVWANGGVVMYNSDRPQALMAETRNNLIAQGLTAEILPDWTFWMQGVDPTNAKPWTVNDNEHTKKELRMDTVNTTTYDISDVAGSGNALKFKTIMRIGDNLNDFNDYASKDKLNEDRISIYENHIKDNFGATNVQGKIVDKEGKVWTNETWNEGYVLIGGNSSYGGWESGLKEGYYKLSDKDQAKARLDGLSAMPIWNGKADWDGKAA